QPPALFAPVRPRYATALLARHSQFAPEMFVRYSALLISFCACSRTVAPADEPIEGVVQAVLTDAPRVPPPISRQHATRVVIHLEVKEVTQRLADGVDFTFWTFGGHVPGKFMRVREGDLVEFHL